MRRTSMSELLIRQRLHALARLLPGAQKGDAELVHRARIATRRLREALPLVVAGARRRKLDRKVRRLTRALGPVRELDVGLQTVDALSAAGEAPRAAIARLKQVIRQERDRLHVVMCREVARVDLDKLRRRVAAGHKRVTAGHKKELAPTRARERAARRATRLHGAIEDAGSMYLPDRLHDVRIAVKKLRYVMEVTLQLSGSRAGARIRRLKEAQDLLGRMHDLEVLIARVRAVQGSPKAPNLRLSSDLDRLVRRLETECRQLHGHYMARRRNLMAICDHIAASLLAQGRRARSRASSAA